MKVLLLGAGGHGRVVLEACRASGLEVIGFLDDSPGKGSVLETPVLGSLGSFEEFKRKVDGAVLGIGDNDLRNEWLDKLKVGSWHLPTVVHPFSSISPSALLGEGVVIVGGVVVNAQTKLDDGVIINTGASVDHDCCLGCCSHVSPGARLAGGVEVGERAWVGAGAVVIEGIHVGAGAVIGAGAVVTEDVPDGAKVAGVPARQIK